MKEMEKVAEIIEEIDEDSEELLCSSVSDSDFKSEINDASIKISNASISLKNTSLEPTEKIKRPSIEYRKSSLENLSIELPGSKNKTSGKIKFASKALNSNSHD